MPDYGIHLPNASLLVWRKHPKYLRHQSPGTTNRAKKKQPPHPLRPYCRTALTWKAHSSWSHHPSDVTSHWHPSSISVSYVKNTLYPTAHTRLHPQRTTTSAPIPNAKSCVHLSRWSYFPFCLLFNNRNNNRSRAQSGRYYAQP